MYSQLHGYKADLKKVERFLYLVVTLTSMKDVQPIQMGLEPTTTSSNDDHSTCWTIT